MIKVYPKIELVAQHIFRDSKGGRQTLNPAETMDNVVKAMGDLDDKKAPQEFDGTDFKAATKIMEQLDAKTILVSKEDRAILNKTLAAGPAGESQANGGDATASKKEIKEAVKTAVDAAADDHAEALEKVNHEHAEELEKVTTDAADDHAEALAKANEDYAQALSKATNDAETAQNDAIAANDAKHETATAELVEAHENVVDGLQEELKKATGK